MDLNIFKLLSDVVKYTSSLGMNYIEDPTDDITCMDAGLRKLFPSSDLLYGRLRHAVITELSFGTILHMQDPFLMNYIVFQPRPTRRSVCSIGPFLTEASNSRNVAQLQKRNHLTHEQLELWKAFAATAPCLPVENVLTTARRLLMMDFGTQTWTVKHLAPSEDEAASTPPAVTQTIADVNAEGDELHLLTEALSQFVSNGDVARALEVLAYLEQHHSPPEPLSPKVLLALLHWANSLYCKAAQSAGVPFNLTSSTFLMFEDMLSNQDIYMEHSAVHLKILTEYCSLCKHHSISQYSPFIQKLLSYIQQNLNKKLDLHILSDYIGFSDTYISHRFKTEVGISPIHYITSQRIRYAQHLLTTTDKTVQEVANTVGITDWSYFAKLFRQHTGMTPSQFRKQ